MTTPLTETQLNRATLARQLLLERDHIAVEAAVRRVTALQAQEPVSPYVALWNRVAGFDPTDLDSAFANRTVVKATLMRITLHAATASDYPSFQRAMLRTLRAARLNDRRFKATGLTIADADALVPHLLDFATKPRSREEIESVLEQQLGAKPDKHVFWALRTYAPLLHAPTGGPWSFTVTAPWYQAAPPSPDSEDPVEALQRLIWRYLEGFGPASAADFAQFALQRQTEIRPALKAMADQLVTRTGPNGGKLLDIPGGVVPDADTVAPPRLLGMWDSTLLAYKDRSRVVPEQYRKLVTRRNGDVLPTLLVDGHVAGVWRPVDGVIEATAFHALGDQVWDGLAREAADLMALLATRDTAVYSRYGHWWEGMPGESRILPG